MDPRAAPKWGFGTTVFAEETKRDRRGADLAEFWYRNRTKVWILDFLGTIKGVFLITLVSFGTIYQISASFFRFSISIVYPLELILGVVIQ